MSLINENDFVDIIYNDHEPTLSAKVLHVPCDVGDMWYFEHKGVTFAQNPMSSNLDLIRLQGIKRGSKRDDKHWICPDCGIKFLVTERHAKFKPCGKSSRSKEVQYG